MQSKRPRFNPLILALALAAVLMVWSVLGGTGSASSSSMEYSTVVHYFESLQVTQFSLDLNTGVITMNLKELGVPQVICKAEGDTQKRALEKIGADKVLIPEREAGVKLAQAVTSSSILDFIELSDQYGIAELTLPEAWVGKTIRELNIRAKYGVNLIAVRENGKINVVPEADEPLPAGCVLVAVGANDKLTRLRG